MTGCRPVDLVRRPHVPSRFGLHRAWLTLLMVALVTLGGWLGQPRSLLAQAQAAASSRPGPEYYAGKLALAEGDFREALKRFRDASRSGVQFGNARWIDSICYYTMIGETLYQLGDTADALVAYEDALRIYVAYHDWMRWVNWPAQIPVESRALRARIGWGQRATLLGRFPDRMSVQVGVVYREQVLQQGGGVLMPAQLYPIDVTEVAYCSAIALRRRLELIGPVVSRTPLTAELYTLMKSPQVARNHWASCWSDVLLGLVAASAGESDEAARLLARGVVLPGNMDHPLSGIALLELGKLAVQADRLAEAAQYFSQATLAAAQYFQGDVVDEAFRYAAALHIASPVSSIYGPLEVAARWAASEELNRTQAALLVTAAETAAAAGRGVEAAALLERSRRSIRFRDPWNGQLGMRWNYASAAANFAVGDVAAGDVQLKAAVTRAQAIAPWLMHVSLTHQLLRQRTISPRIAGQLYDYVLREPTPRDWVIDPLQSLALLSAPLDSYMSQWLQIALDGKDLEKALWINDAFRRRRFFQSLPYGGRRLALGFVAAGPGNLLGQQSQQERQHLHGKYPVLAQLAQEADTLRAALAELEGVQDEEGIQRRSQLAQQLAANQAKLLAFVQRLVLGHDPAHFVFLPPRTADLVQKRLPKGHAALVFIPSGSSWTAVLLRADSQAGDYVMWRVPMQAVRRQTADFLRAIGNANPSQRLDPTILTSVQWQEPARRLAALIFNEMPDQLWNQIDQLVIVPDEALWYLPFEALLIGEAPDEEYLIERTAIRYLPLLSLAGPKETVAAPESLSVVYFPTSVRSSNPEQQQQNAQRQEAYRRVAEVRWLQEEPRAPLSALLASWDRLLVWDNLEGSGRGDLNWSPAGRLGGSLLAWMSTFGYAPSQLLLPGFHTAAEEGLRSPATGNECFLAACGLSVAGVRSALLSRWPVGGQTTDELMRQMLQELPHSTAADAWRRSVQLVWSLPLDSTAEPRLKEFPEDQPLLRAEHPFFWAGYLLIDDGRPPLDPQHAPPPVIAQGAEEADGAVVLPPANPQAENPAADGAADAGAEARDAAVEAAVGAPQGVDRVAEDRAAGDGIADDPIADGPPVENPPAEQLDGGDAAGEGSRPRPF